MGKTAVSHWGLSPASPKCDSAVYANRRVLSVVAKSEVSVKVLPFGKVVAKATYRLGEGASNKSEQVVVLPETTLQTTWFSSSPRLYR
jgi:hypothetical protein